MNIKYLSLTASVALLAFNAYAKKQPNVIFIYGDDVGLGDVGVYGAKMIPTPNIDKLASQGLVFTDGHCSAATCTPSRYSLLTGIHGFRDNISILPPNAPLTISTEILTLPKLFKKANYTTAVIGKWHLGIGEKGKPVDWNGDVKPGPMEIGFDYSFLLPSTNDRVPCVYLDGHKVVNADPADPIYVGQKNEEVGDKSNTVYPDGKTNTEAMTFYKSTHGHNNSVINGVGRIGYMSGGKTALWNDETMADVFVEKAREYIGNNKNKPFFLYFASQDIHVPRMPHPRFRGKSELGYRGDAMVQFDWTTGEIMKILEENGLTENTIIILSSDNGPVYDDGYEDGTMVKESSGESDRGHDGSGIYRGGKYQIYEGGTRVPFIIRWPKMIKPGKSDALVNQIDFIASFADYLNIELAEEDAYDSRNVWNSLIGENSKGLDFMLEEATGNRKAIRVGSWKYITGNKNTEPELFNLETDPQEAVNIIVEKPEKAESMKQQLQSLIKQGRVRK